MTKNICIYCYACLSMVVYGSIVQSQCLLPDQDTHLHEWEEKVEDEPGVFI